VEEQRVRTEELEASMRAIHDAVQSIKADYHQVSIFCQKRIVTPAVSTASIAPIDAQSS